ncbi:hypothetical protein [Jannaschia sp. Os4]|uniref:hypothetical protein n=1 Tax=Jannaschia sp. Os4 TaxID=2807617 RepID=UPI001EEF19E3|nr:hypothetical protein [Jannaschia sp. Os4]
MTIPFPDPSGRAGPVLPAPCPPTLSEAFPDSALDPGPIGFVLAALPRGPRPVLWVQDHATARESGVPYALGLPIRVIHVRASNAADALMAIETGLACSALGAVIGEIWGAPKRLDFTATKRLALRAEAAALPCWLLRRGAEPDLSAARQRWRVASLPSNPDPWDVDAPGDPRWRATLFRSRLGPPGVWEATHDRAADRLDLAPPAGDRAVVADAGARPRRATG